jgi:hypothetical protein
MTVWQQILLIWAIGIELEKMSSMKITFYLCFLPNAMSFITSGI